MIYHSLVETNTDGVYYNLTLLFSGIKRVHLSNFFRKKLTALLVISLAVLITSCASPERKVKVKESEKFEVKEIEQTTDDAEQLVAKAKMSDETTANNLLIQASQKYLTEQQPNKALWLSAHLLKLDQTPTSQYQLNLIAAEASWQLGNTTLAEQYINNCELLSTDKTLAPSLVFYQLQLKLAQQNNQHVEIANALLHIFHLNQQATTEDSKQIWQTLQGFSQWQQAQLNNLNPPLIKGWLALLQTGNKFGGSEQFNRQLITWQKKYPSHPGNTIVSELLNNQEQFSSNYQNIAVILPLTGKQHVAGQSAQQGVLAAYEKHQNINLNFIDANTLDFSTLTIQLNELNIDFIIGPLLKEHVQQFLALADINIPTLLLNIPEQLELKPHQFALSMRPEDEAIQAATILSQQNFKLPIVLSHSDSTSERISTAFTQTWLTLTGNKPDVVNFEQGKKMQDILKNTLGIEQSQKRINTLRYRLRETIDIEPRSRRDIDMIYIVGNAQQTRLLKPYIDVNTSPFADIIPVFSSSRSHSVNTDDSTLNDLRGLTFTQIPFLLPSKLQNKKLVNSTKQLWPERNDSLHKIFAMGFDSLEIINKLKLMKANEFIRHYGQTGVLKLNFDNILTRSLLWGRYQRKNVAEIKME